jgi:outer membrane protein assembly factor BamB
MIWRWKKGLWAILPIPFGLLGLWLWRLDSGIDTQLGAPRGEPLQVVVMDPQGGPLRRDGLSRPARDYAPLGRLLTETLHRQVEFSYGDGWAGTPAAQRAADLIIGKDSTVAAEAARLNEPVRPLARLTDERGETGICGLFVVRRNDPAQTPGDLADHTIVFGPPAEPERHSLALAALSQQGVVPVPPLETAPTCRDALQRITRRQADAAVISSANLALVEDGTAVNQDAFRVIGRTVSRPFITVFATSRIGPATERTIAEALLSVKAQPPLLQALQSRAGFVPLRVEPEPKSDRPAPVSTSGARWADWRGPDRAGLSPDVPARLPPIAQFLWKHGLTGAGLSGITATTTHVLVADKSESKDQDIWRCLDADTGKELWTVAYTTPRQMEFTNVPRATPVIQGQFVYLLGAFGDLHCVSLCNHEIVWRRNIIRDFGAKLPTWGTCSTPLVVGDRLIVNPGAADASLVALDLYTGEVIWKTPGPPAAYASLIVGMFGGVRQIVGYDAESLGGWDPNTGQRLWTLVPDKKGDYNVPTPINVDGRLLVATENNGTRLYDFECDGRIRPVPIARTASLAPDSSTPIVVDGLVFGCSRGLFCLDLNDGLKTLYSTDGDGAFKEYTAFLAGSGRVLAVTVRGELLLFPAARDAFTPIDRLQVFDGAEVWSYPAFVGNRLYLRSMKEVCCLLLSDS